MRKSAYDKWIKDTGKTYTTTRLVYGLNRCCGKDRLRNRSTRCIFNLVLPLRCLNQKIPASEAEHSPYSVQLLHISPAEQWQGGAKIQVNDILIFDSYGRHIKNAQNNVKKDWCTRRDLLVFAIARTYCQAAESPIDAPHQISAHARDMQKGMI